MKSLVEEASSIVKAIESAWNRAGKPQEFSVKILEHPETGFLGLKTVKSAKVAIFFTEVQRAEPQQRPVGRRDANAPQRPMRPPQDRMDRVERPERPTPERQERTERPERQDRQDRPERSFDRRDRPPRMGGGRPDQRRDGRYEQRGGENRYQDRNQDSRYNDSRSNEPASGGEQRLSWTSEFVETAQEWLKETLVLTGQPDANVKSHVSQNYLKLIIDKPIADDPRQEEMLLKSWTNLAYDAVQEKAKQRLYGLRLFIETARRSGQ